eukprot:1160803-Pelagomonas_calceolata.AAC.10
MRVGMCLPQPAASARVMVHGYIAEAWPIPFPSFHLIVLYATLAGGCVSGPTARARRVAILAWIVFGALAEAVHMPTMNGVLVAGAVAGPGGLQLVQARICVVCACAT